MEKEFATGLWHIFIPLSPPPLPLAVAMAFKHREDALIQC